MRIDVHDVGHGHCSVITCPNGQKVMVDCGYQANPGWYPSTAYAGTDFALLAVTNLDEDHLDDLPFASSKLGFQALYSNPTITADALALMKPNGMKPGVQFMHDVLSRRGSGLIGRLPDLGEVLVHAFSNTFRRDFTDTNNLSVALFVTWGNFTVLFAGDLETAGWRSLMGMPGFAQCLAQVRVLVASHHGRANGRCNEAFQIMKPDVVVFSDDAKQYESQDTDAWYRARVLGITDTTNATALGGYGRRHVLSTRRDGHLSMTVNTAGGYIVCPERLSMKAPLPWSLTRLGDLALLEP